MLTLRYGSKRIALKPGKPAIEIGEEAQLVPTLKLVRQAVAAGELDKLLMTAKEAAEAALSRPPGRYTRQVLQPGEEVIAVGRFHWLYTVVAILCLFRSAASSSGSLIFARMMIEKWTTEIVITSDRLIYKRGWIARHVEEIALNRIEEVVLDQSVMGRVLGYGSIIVAGMGRGVIELPSWLADPVELRRFTNSRPKAINRRCT